jgi:hypothetical protein
MVETPKPSDIQTVFAMNDPQHMWVKLAWELQQLTESMSVWVENDPYPEPLFWAFNTAVTAWHISDWLWQSNAKNRAILTKRFGFSSKETKNGRRNGLKKFQRCVAEQNRALHVCRYVANGSKHMRLEKTDPNIRAFATWDPVVEKVGLVKLGDLN